MSNLVIHTVGSLGINAGGPSRTVPSLCLNTIAADPSLDFQLCTGEGSKFGENISFDGLKVSAIALDSGTSQFRRLLRQLSCSNQGGGDKDTRVILHDHGQWLPINRASAAIAREKKLRRIVTPRGMLSPWSLSHRKLKKTLAWWLFACRDFHEAFLLHATSELEANELRNLGARQPIAIIPNGVEFHLSAVDSALKTKTALFMSRLHPKKGVSELVEVWRRMRPNGWELILAGPDESGLASKLNLSRSDSIKYVGEVQGEYKWRLLQQSSLFVLPSFSENFGVVVAEALIAGTPVIATHGTPWKSLVENECGWWIPATPAALENSLRDAMSYDLDKLAMMGLRGRQHAVSSFSWPSIGHQMASVYQWMLDRADKPDFVYLQ